MTDRGKKRIFIKTIVVFLSAVIFFSEWTAVGGPAEARRERYNPYLSASAEIPLNNTVKVTFLDEKGSRVAKEELTYAYPCLSQKETEAALAYSAAKGLEQKEALDTLLPGIKKAIESTERSFFRPGKDARAVFEPSSGTFCYIAEKEGVELDFDRLYREIVPQFGRGSINIIARTKKSGIVTQAELRANTIRISRFATGYSSSSENRKHNISLAAGKLNGYTLGPGESFSFNGTVGARTAERGYRECKIVLDGQFIEGVGGGVCQVSTTLYNAVLRAGLRVDNAAGHSVRVGYVPPSFDAMVSSVTDFRFTNDTPYPIYIRAVADGSRLAFEIYGRPAEEHVNFRSEVLETIPFEEVIIEDETLTEDSRRASFGQEGMISEGYADYYEEGILIKSDRIRRDIYKPVKGKTLVKKERGAIPGRSRAPADAVELNKAQ